MSVGESGPTGSSARRWAADEMTAPDQQDDRDGLGDGSEGTETGSAPQPLDFPGADEEPPGRPDGDEDPDQDQDQDQDQD